MSASTRIAALFLPLAAALAPNPAAAVIPPTVQTTFYFSGNCTDCTGVGLAELVLSNYTLGNAVTSNNFISFHYDGTNLLPGGFTISGTTGLNISGSISAPLPGAEMFAVSNAGYYFSSDTNGNWSLGRAAMGRSDYGTAAIYDTTAPAVVPEPISLALLGAGLAGTALVRRRRA